MVACTCLSAFYMQAKWEEDEYAQARKMYRQAPALRMVSADAGGGYTPAPSLAAIQESSKRTPEPSEPKAVSQPSVVPSSANDINALRAKYPNIIGWITIPDTPVDYPIVQGQDNQYYVEHNFKGNRSASGAIFLDCSNALDDQNLVLYGHNMGRGRSNMFSTLPKYEKQSYWSAHPELTLELDGQTTTWRVFAAFQFNIDEDNAFPYTRHSFLNDEDFQSFVRDAKALTPYDTGVNVPDGSRIVSLSTCDRRKHGASGRFAVLAVLAVQ